MKMRIRYLMLVGVVLVGAMGWWGWIKGPSLASLREEAASFVAPDSWRVLEESGKDRQPFCRDIPCPSLFIRWELDTAPTIDEVEQLVRDANWDVISVGDDCRPTDPDSLGPFQQCEVAVAAAGFDGTLRFPIRDNNAADRPYIATLLLA